MRTLFIILTLIFLVSCGNEHKSTHKKTERRISLIQGEPIKLEYGLQTSNGQRFLRIVLNKSDFKLKNDLELAHFTIDENSSDVRFFSRDFKTHYLSKHNHTFKDLPWTSASDAINFDAHRRLNFSFDSRTNGYPSLKNDYVFIEMNDAHDEQSFKLVIDMYCATEEVYRRGYPSICKNNDYKLRIKFFEINKL